MGSCGRDLVRNVESRVILEEAPGSHGHVPDRAVQEALPPADPRALLPLLPPAPPPRHVPLPPLTRRDLCGHGRDRMASHGKVSLVASESDRQRGCWEGVGQKTFILKDSIS